MNQIIIRYAPEVRKVRPASVQVFDGSLQVEIIAYLHEKVVILGTRWRKDPRSTRIQVQLDEANLKIRVLVDGSLSAVIIAELDVVRRSNDYEPYVGLQAASFSENIQLIGGHFFR